ncbi:MAG TPA: type VI secretion system transmembrane protein TssQ [Dysgonomonas sp.]|nr:type VI secretion system transmembrane protein TssQ [Dysgonomonas sp.]
MKSKNNEDVRRGMLRFSLFLVATIFLGISVFFGFMKTASVEVSKILAKSKEYDKIQIQQVRLTESVDSIYHYMRLLNVDHQINNLLMHNYLSNMKLRVTRETSVMENKDVRFYSKLASQMGVFLETKDSIRIAKRDEELIRMDLARCISENRQITRRMAIGGLTYR